MRKGHGVAVVILLVICFAVAMGGHAAPASSSSYAAEQASGAAQSQMSSDQLSPAAQEKLTKKVQHTLIMLPYYGTPFDWIQFELQGRTVILQGQVVNPTLKPDAEKSVKRIEGVEKVVNNIEVLPPSPLDARLRRAIERAIYTDGPLFKYSHMPNPPIRIIVNSARVTLEGVVDTETDKNLCTIRVNQVPGVLSVTNNLRVVKG